MYLTDGADEAYKSIVLCSLLLVPLSLGAAGWLGQFSEFLCHKEAGERAVFLLRLELREIGGSLFGS